MYRAVIIGLGTIARHHVEALQTQTQIRICAVCDVREQAADNPLYAQWTFYKDYRDMLVQEKPDIAIVTTPPGVHLEIAQECFRLGIIPWVEKPLAMDAEDIRCFLSEPLQKYCVPVYHSICGPEVIWFLREIPLHKINSIQIAFDDPYASAEGVIQSQKIALGGCWLDSGVNAFAWLSRLIPLEEMQTLQLTHGIDADSGLPYRTLYKAEWKQTEIEIHLHWERGLNRKQTMVEADGHCYLIDHSAQSVSRDSELLFKDDSCERLTAQYRNFYSCYPQYLLPLQTTEFIYQIITK